MTAGLEISQQELHDLFVVQLELVSELDFQKATAMVGRLRVPLERVISDRLRIPSTYLLKEIAQSWDIGFVDLKIGDVRPEALQKLPEQYARSKVLVPFDMDGSQLSVALWNPRDRRVLSEIEQRTGLKVKPYLAPINSIQSAHLLYRSDLYDMLRGSTAPDGILSRGVRHGSEEQAAGDLLKRLVEYAVVSKASDVHIEPFELETLVRYRIDGVLREVLSLPPADLVPLIARIKIVSTMRIDEKRAPQDGRFDIDLGGFSIDVRVSSIPTHWGEKIVMRILEQE